MRIPSPNLPVLFDSTDLICVISALNAMNEEEPTVEEEVVFEPPMMPKRKAKVVPPPLRPLDI